MASDRPVGPVLSLSGLRDAGPAQEHWEALGRGGLGRRLCQGCRRSSGPVGLLPQRGLHGIPQGCDSVGGWREGGQHVPVTPSEREPPLFPSPTLGLPGSGLTLAYVTVGTGTEESNKDSPNPQSPTGPHLPEEPQGPSSPEGLFRS